MTDSSQQSVINELKDLKQLMLDQRFEYLVYRGSSMDLDGNLFWAKDDVLAYTEGIEAAIGILDSRIDYLETRG